jgi:rubrerythrin
MNEMTEQAEDQLVAQLNDLLQLDYDAVQAYRLAISLLSNPEYKAQLRDFRADHERHIDELSRLVANHGGVPVEMPHLPTGVFKLAVQAAGRVGGDRGVLLAFKANERQVRDKYRRAAESRQPPEVAVILSRAAGDESLHYSWVLETLEDLGAGEATTVGRIEQAVEIGHARMADVVEGAERRAMEGVEEGRRVAAERPLSSVLIAVGAGFIVGQLLRRE